MNRMSRSAIILLATLVVALTPVFAYADVGRKDKFSVDQNDLLSKVEHLMGEADFDAANHGDVVSFAAQNFQELAAELNLGDRKVSRGQLISIIARSDAGKANDGAAKDGKVNNGKRDKEKQNNGKHDKDGDEPSGDATPTATPVPATATPTTTAVPETATPTATAVPETATPTATTVPETATPTATAVPETETPTATVVPGTATPTATVVPGSETPTLTTTLDERSNRGRGHGNQKP